MPGLTNEERADFLAGAEEFAEQESAAEGLGPLFNGASCGQCHSSFGLGGAGMARIVRILCRDSNGIAREPAGGGLIHLFSTRPELSAATIQKDCDAVETERRTTNLLGAGLLEAIEDEQLLAEEAAQANGFAGRAARIVDVASGRERIGRLGWKAQHASLETFAGEAYRNELGITNELFPDEIAPGGDAAMLAAMDPVPDPEAPVGAVNSLAAFMRFLAPPMAPAPNERALEIFRDIGCAGCHRESYTIPASLGPIAGREARLYSDLLLHDIGTGDGIAQAAATADELRTPPLWGLGRSPFYLHDGRALSIEEAVAEHAGQATPARAAYDGLPELDRTLLLDFLVTL